MRGLSHNVHVRCVAMAIFDHERLSNGVPGAGSDECRPYVTEAQRSSTTYVYLSRRPVRPPPPSRLTDDFRWLGGWAYSVCRISW